MKLEQPDFLEDMEPGAMTREKIWAAARNLKKPKEKSNLPSLRRAFEHFEIAFNDPRFPMDTFWNDEILGPRAKKREARKARLNGGGNGSNSSKGDWSHLPPIEKHPKAKQINEMKKRRDVYDND